jgi:hypothetical protein
MANNITNNNRGKSSQQGNKKGYGQAQAEFIKKTRNEIDEKGTAFFANRDWTQISYGGGRYCS